MLEQDSNQMHDAMQDAGFYDFLNKLQLNSDTCFPNIVAMA